MRLTARFIAAIADAMFQSAVTRAGMRLQAERMDRMTVYVFQSAVTRAGMRLEKISEALEVPMFQSAVTRAGMRLTSYSFSPRMARCFNPLSRGQACACGAFRTSPWVGLVSIRCHAGRHAPGQDGRYIGPEPKFKFQSAVTRAGMRLARTVDTLVRSPSLSFNPLSRGQACA